MKVLTGKICIAAATLGLGACSMLPPSSGLAVRTQPTAPFPALSGDNAPTLNYSTAAMTPAEWRNFCYRNRDDCAPRADKTLELTPKVWRVLNQANQLVNRRLPYADDMAATGMRDRWDTVNIARATAVGDCEDSALTKRSMLLKAGVPANALKLAIVQRPNVKDRVAGNHAVLVVSTHDGDFVMDSLDYRIRRVSDTAYRFLKVHTPTSARPDKWHWVHGAQPVVAMRASGEDVMKLAKAGQ